MIDWGNYWLYELKAYRPTNQGGDLILHTRHSSEISKDIELDVMLARRRRGEIGHIELLNRAQCTTVQV